MVMNKPQPTICIVGGGFTGAAAAIALLHRHDRPFDLVIVEGSPALGRGVAFGGQHPLHLLNVRTRDLSVFADRPGDFLNWVFLQLGQGEDDMSLHEGLAHSFLPRQMFGAYTRQRLFEAIDKRRDVRCTIQDGVVTSCRKKDQRFAVKVEGREAFGADVVMLATAYGFRDHQASGPLTPFDVVPPVQLMKARTAVFVGAGLSMVDALAAARRDGFTGTATVISRRGLLPKPHAAKGVVPLQVALPSSKSVARMASAVRIACEAAAAHGTPWQAVFNGLRPQVQAIWQGLQVEEQSRFLRHLRSFWDAHRHRLPSEVHAQLQAEFDRGQAIFIKGKVKDIRRENGAFKIEIVRRGTARSELIRADLAFDCTGHRPDLASPLISGLFAAGLASPDAHRLGLAAMPDGRAIGAGGIPTKGLFALGPLCQGTLWEITAVPEIVSQAEAAAAAILSAAETELYCTEKVLRCKAEAV